jgi:lipopolysaccharide export LptBFGC system permease protein LptF
VWRGSLERVQVALHGRLAAGLAPLFMGLFAMGMALLVPAAGRRVRHFLLGFLPPVLIYFPLFLAGPYLGRVGTLPAWLVMWLPVFVVGLAGSVLLALAYRR